MLKGKKSNLILNKFLSVFVSRIYRGKRSGILLELIFTVKQFYRNLESILSESLTVTVVSLRKKLNVNSLFCLLVT